jgi:hypothetical protein
MKFVDTSSHVPEEQRREPHQPPSSRGSMSYTAHHRSHHGACSPEARGSGVWASRDPQAATSGQAATTAHTPDRHHAGYPTGPGRTRTTLLVFGLAWPRELLLACPRSSPSPVDAATMGRPDDAQTWRPAPRPSTAARSGGRAMTWRAGTAAVAGTNSPRPDTTPATAFRDRDGPVHKDTAGSSSRSRNHSHPRRDPTTMS